MQNLNFSRDDCLLLSKMAHQTGRSKDMIHFSSKFCNLETELSLEERNTLASAYRLSICTKREELETLNLIEHSEKKTANKKDLEYIRNYKYTIENELKSLCYEIIRIIDVNLLANVKEGTESHVFYLKMKGDYYR